MCTHTCTNMYFQVQRDYLKTNYWKKHITKFDNENYKMEMDIEGFHSFVKFLIAKGAAGPWGGRQRHWRRYVDVCKGTSLEVLIFSSIFKGA